MDTLTADTPFLLGDDRYVVRTHCEMDTTTGLSVDTVAIYAIDTETNSIDLSNAMYKTQPRNIWIRLDKYTRTCVYTSDDTVFIVMGDSVNNIYCDIVKRLGDNTKFEKVTQYYLDGCYEFECTQNGKILYCITFESENKKVIIHTLRTDGVIQKTLPFDVTSCNFCPSSATDVFAQLYSNNKTVFTGMINLQSAANGDLEPNNQYSDKYTGDVLCCYQGIVVTGKMFTDDDGGNVKAKVRMYSFENRCEKAKLLAEYSMDDVRLYGHHRHQFYMSSIDVIGGIHTVTLLNNEWSLRLEQGFGKDDSGKYEATASDKNIVMLKHNKLLLWQYADDTRTVFDLGVHDAPTIRNVSFCVDSVRTDIDLEYECIEKISGDNVTKLERFNVNGVDRTECTDCCVKFVVTSGKSLGFVNAAINEERVNWIVPLYMDNKGAVIVASIYDKDTEVSRVYPMLTRRSKLRDGTAILKYDHSIHELSSVPILYNDNTDSRVVQVSASNHSSIHGLVVTRHDDSKHTQLIKVGKALKETDAYYFYSIYVYSGNIPSVGDIAPDDMHRYMFKIAVSENMTFVGMHAYSVEDDNLDIVITYNKVTETDESINTRFCAKVFSGTNIKSSSRKLELKEDKNAYITTTLSNLGLNDKNTTCCFSGMCLYVLSDGVMHILNVYRKTCTSHVVGITDAVKMYPPLVFGSCSYPDDRRVYVENEDKKICMLTF